MTLKKWYPINEEGLSPSPSSGETFDNFNQSLDQIKDRRGKNDFFDETVLAAVLLFLSHFVHLPSLTVIIL